VQLCENLPLGSTSGTVLGSKVTRSNRVNSLLSKTVRVAALSSQGITKSCVSKNIEARMKPLSQHEKMVERSEL